MQKIGLLNFHYGNKNYGAVLQAAALQYFLKSHGHTPQNIDFQPDGSFGHPFLDFLRKIKRLPQKWKNPSADPICSSAFDQFRSRWIDITEKRYTSVAQLKKAPFDFDVYIVGSDQVWRNEYTQKAIDAYFFSFVRDPEAIRIAYAASFGLEQWELPNKHRKTRQVVELVKQFNFISVREDSGIKICKETLGTHASLVLDPTLLVGRAFFDILAQDADFKDGGEYIAVYKLDSDESFIAYLRAVENQTGLKAQDIYKKKNGEKMFYSRVEDWVAMIRGAKLVVTDSFHCCCLAVIYNRPLIYYPPGHNRGMTRIHSLFKRLSLEQVGAIRPKLSDLKFITLPKGYNKVNALLSRLRKRDSKLLLNALGKDR